jgi:hypothetical protein
MSAYRRWRITSVVSTVVWLIGLVPVIVLRDGNELVSRITPAQWAFYLLPIAVAIVVAGLLYWWAWRRAQAEGAAGYTTRTSGYTKYDQVNPRTGDVIRRAGSAVLTLPSATGDGADDSGDSGDSGDSSSGAPRFTGKSMARPTKLILWIGGVVMVLVIALISYSGFGSDVVDATILFVSMVVGLAVLVGGVFLGVMAYFRGYLTSARQARPEAFLFLTTLTPELQQAATSVDLTLPRTRNFAVTLSSQGLEFWGRKSSLDPITAVPWSSIVRVQPGRLLVSSGNGRPFAAPTLHVFRNVAGEELDFPVPVFGPRSFSYASPDDANKVLDVVGQYARIADAPVVRL